MSLEIPAKKLRCIAAVNPPPDVEMFIICVFDNFILTLVATLTKTFLGWVL